MQGDMYLSGYFICPTKTKPRYNFLIAKRVHLLLLVHIGNITFDIYNDHMAWIKAIWSQLNKQHLLYKISGTYFTRLDWPKTALVWGGGDLRNWELKEKTIITGKNSADRCNYNDSYVIYIILMCLAKWHLGLSIDLTPWRSG